MQASSRLSNNSPLPPPLPVVAALPPIRRHGRCPGLHGGNVAWQKSLSAIRTPAQPRDRPPHQLREELKAAIDEDAETYNQVLAAYKLAKTSSDGEAADRNRHERRNQRPNGNRTKAREV